MSDHDRIVAATTELLLALGVDPSKEPGVRGTPERVARAWKEMTVGYDAMPSRILETQFQDRYDEMIVCSNIDFTSICEHHLLPFTGKAHVGYIPNGQGKVVGLSKLARLVDCFAKRLQIQERMTAQIIDALWDSLSPLGAGVIIQAHHMCMSCRGVMKSEAVMSTAKLRGCFKENPATRAEFMRYAQ